MKKYIYIGIAVVLIIALALSALAFLNHIRNNLFRSPDPIEFSKEAWDANPYDRAPMVKDLLQKYDFMSMTKDEVIDLLGEKRLDVGEETLRYETGGGFLNDEILRFVFNKNGKIINVGIAN